ncbi:MAG: hypothetical protein Tsb0027_24940 [Wenzhouxiangellaceae bacterium]
MNPETILNLPKEHLRTFVALMISFIVLGGLAEWLLTDTAWGEIATAYLRSVVTATVTSLFVLWVAASFLPRQTRRKHLVELQPTKITAEFDKMLAAATRWRYKGNFGRYMRGKVLPELANRQNCHVIGCIIDPANESLCEKHAEYRSQINSIDKGRKYDANEVALEVLVTVVICAWYFANSRTRVELFFSASFDPVRIDSNDERMILTVEDRRRPALLVEREHFTYEHFEMSMEFARTQGRAVDLSGMRSSITLAQLEREDVSSVLARAGLSELCDKLTAERILIACREAKNPYAD